ncbi:MAG TPA: S8 family serine peptidase [Microlunatus sp.]|nr:S8 family serine peptidase [Microlunatus sp.]
MTLATPRRGRAGFVALGLSAVLICALMPPASAEPTDGLDLPIPTEVSAPGEYIVTLADAPVAAYDGDVAGYDATQPDEGDAVDVASSDAKRYRSYLRGRQDKAAARVGAKPRDRYEVGLNAFTTQMTGRQATSLARTDGVISVVENTLRKVPDDRKSTDFLGLSGYDGVWSRLGGTDDAGLGVVVGVIDSGIWPESASFAGEPLGTSSAKVWRSSGKRYQPQRVGDSIVMRKSDGGVFRGACETGEGFTAADCSTKLVGARYFGDAWLAEVPADQRDDYVSPRGRDGHGTHTASIAAGNHGVRAVVDGRDFGRISGVAPAAKIATYKVLWQAKKATDSGAYDSDILAAIEAAICDGVDVINYSITAADNPTSPVATALLAAASAGIFVAASAGNSGPAASTVQSTAPWVTTVGAHTIAPYYGTVTLGNGEKYAGVSTSVDDPVGPAPLVNGSAVAVAGQAGKDAVACAPGSLDPAKTEGKIVVCARGVVDRTVKSAEVERAGAIGMVLANLTDDTLDADLHSVPTVHLNPPASNIVTAYAGKPGATATLTDGNQTSTRLAYPQIASFSARGPSLGTGGDTLKPDLVAPGVSILAAVSPPSNDDQDFGFLSGTSQSAPQVAGLAALWFGAGVHPTWSPMQVKSALMTTATDLVNDSGAKVTNPFAQGAGRVVPERMLAPGLVYPAGQRDWLGYLEGLGHDTGTGVRAIDPSDYNSPSIAIGSLAATQTVTRRVTAAAPGRYRVSAQVPGVDVEVSPATLDFDRAGQTKSFKVTFSRTTAALDKATSGFLTWKSSRASVRIPLVVTPRAVDAPREVTASGTSDGLRFGITPGESGTFTATATGLATGSVRTGSLALDQAFAYLVPIPAGTKAARFTVRSPAARANLDLEVYQYVNNVPNLIGQVRSSGPNESFVLPQPAAGNYALQVINVANAPGTTSTSFTAQAGLAQPDSGTGGFAVTPASTQATAGVPIRLRATWSGLDDATPYVGWIEYPNGSGTVVSVN